MAQYKHIVLMRFPPQVERESVAGIFEALDDLRDRVAGIVDISSGPYDSPEGLNKGFTHALVVTFADEESRDACLQDSRYEQVRQMIAGELAGGLADMVAFDFKLCDRFRY